MRGAAALLSLALPALAFSAEGPCPRLAWTGGDPGLTEVEKRLVCGDPDIEGWREIPLTQARDFLEAFLQKRGYHYPTFRPVGETLEVDIGTITFVNQVTGGGMEGIFDLGKRRRLTGERLTPALLDKAKKAVLFEYQSRGFMCPAIEVTADARSGVIDVVSDPGLFYRFPKIPAPKLDKLDPAVFNRFEAFARGEPMDIRLLSLTSDRIKSEALFLSAYYDLSCTTTSLRIVQRVVEAPPRMFTIGVGADTEGLVIGKVRWRHSRIGWRASSTETNIFASLREQSLDSYMRFYLSPADRLHLRPGAILRRENEVQWEATRGRLDLSPVWQTDTADYRVETRGGPAVNYFDTTRGRGPLGDKWFSFVTRTEVNTHMWEYFQRDPQRGWAAEFETASRIAGAYSDVSAHRLRLAGQSLWNLGRYDPPYLVLATRGFAGTLRVSDRGNAFDQTPPPDRFYLGGDADIRGFDRRRLPDDGLGFLTAIYQGVELRAGDVLPYRLQPLIFLDGAMGGQRHFHLDGDVFWSPGVGLRWASPVGTVRTTLARGNVWRHGTPEAEPPKPRLQFFFSFGREF